MTHSSYCSLSDPQHLICDNSLQTGWYIDKYRIEKRGRESLSRYSDSLRAGRTADRIPEWASFSSPVQTGLGSYPASYTMGTESPSRM